jgi:hypothetical protein
MERKKRRYGKTFYQSCIYLRQGEWLEEETLTSGRSIPCVVLE